jgi:hypothetical protein
VRGEREERGGEIVFAIDTPFSQPLARLDLLKVVSLFCCQRSAFLMHVVVGGRVGECVYVERTTQQQCDHAAQPTEITHHGEFFGIKRSKKY